MRTVCKTIYTYDELPTDKAKEKARDWLKGLAFTDSSDWQYTVDHIKNMGEILGINFKERKGETYGGKTIYAPMIWFQLNYCQGDGAAFDGTYRYALGSAKKIRSECNDETLVSIADALADIQKRHFYKLRADISSRGMCISVDVHDVDDEYIDVGDAEKEIAEEMRRFTQWMYTQFRNENDYQSSDEYVIDILGDAPYEFNEDGTRAVD